MRRNLLYSAAILLALSTQALADGANSAAPASGTVRAEEVPQTSSSQDTKQAGESGEARTDSGAADAAAAQAAQQRSVFGSGCFGFFGSRTFPLVSRGTVYYRVVPTTFFDVKMRVTYVGLRSWTVDRFWAPGAESITIRGPAIAWPVKVTISGVNGQRGCFNMFAG